MILTVSIEDEAYRITDATTAGEVKQRAGLDDDKALAYREDRALQALDDDDIVAAHVEPQSTLEVFPLSDTYVFR